MSTQWSWPSFSHWFWKNLTHINLLRDMPSSWKRWGRPWRRHQTLPMMKTRWMSHLQRRRSKHRRPRMQKPGKTAQPSKGKTQYLRFWPNWVRLRFRYNETCLTIVDSPDGGTGTVRCLTGLGKMQYLGSMEAFPKEKRSFRRYCRLPVLKCIDQWEDSRVSCDAMVKRSFFVACRGKTQFLDSMQTSNAVFARVQAMGDVVTVYVSDRAV